MTASRTDPTSLVDTVCDALRDVPGDPTALAERHVGRHAPLLHGARREAVVRAVVARLSGLGDLDALVADPDVDEVLVNRGGEVWVEVSGSLRRHGEIAPDALAVILERVLAPTGRRLDRSDPIVDARLPDGSRVCAVVPPVSVDGPVLAIRRPRRSSIPVHRFGPPDVAALLAALVRGRGNVVVSGATSSGKTTLLAALAELAPPTERLVVLEDTAELPIEAPHVVRLEARAATPDGPPAIPLDRLVRTALRLRPDRLIVGEVRGDEVLALVQAMNTGHDGSLSTVHANSAHDAVARLESLVLQAAPSWPLAAVRSNLTRSIDAIVHVTRSGTASRLVTEVAEPVADSDPVRLHHLVRAGRVVGTPTRSRTAPGPTPASTRRGAPS